MGVAAGRGFNVNIPWDGPDMGNGDYLSAFNQLLIPIAYEFNPDLIIVSAGFDAADGDPIGECRVTPECFAHMTSLLKAIAPLVLLLEGGYNLGSTAASTEACLRVLLGEQPGCLPGARFPSPCGWKAIEEARRVQSQFWRSLQPPAPTRLHEPAALCVGSASWSDRGRATISAEAGPQRSDTPQHFSPQDERLGLGRSPGPTLAQRLLRPIGGQAGRSRTRILLTIHKRAMRAFWNRRRRSAAPSL